ncbi:MAG TPA: tetratricopeptide repeat protein [Candidatus Koribacter sp.]|jgi:tetratricopeptide (TPR) repeat protein
MSLIVRTNLARVICFERRYDDALAEYRRIQEMDANFPPLLFRLAELLELKGDFAQAIPLHQRWAMQISKAPTATSEQVEEHVEDALKREGPKGYWRARIELMIAANKPGADSTADIAFAYGQLGDKDKAFEWLSRAVNENVQESAWMNANPICDPLRSDPRWEQLLRRVGVTPVKVDVKQ